MAKSQFIMLYTIFINLQCVSIARSDICSVNLRDPIDSTVDICQFRSAVSNLLGESWKREIAAKFKICMRVWYKRKKNQRISVFRVIFIETDFQSVILLLELGHYQMLTMLGTQCVLTTFVLRGACPFTMSGTKL